MANIQNIQQFGSEIIQYVISPAIVLGIILFLLNKMYKFGSLNQMITTVVKDVDELKKDGKKLLSHIDIIKTHLVDKTGLDANLFGPGSPLKLLPNGIKLLDSSGFKDIYHKNKEWFVAEAKKENVATLAEIDETSLKIVEKCAKDKKFMDYKELAFQNGVPVDVLLKVISIYLRDELAKELLRGK